MLKIVCSIIILSSFFVSASDREYSHFKALEPASTAEAFCFLAKYNAELAAITSKEKMSPEDMVKVHELTYTIENAVGKLKDSLTIAAEDLEKTHKASEILKHDVIKESAQMYLKEVADFTTKATCK